MGAQSRRMWTAIGCFAVVFFLGFVSMKCDPTRRRLPVHGHQRFNNATNGMETYDASLQNWRKETREEMEAREINSVAKLDLARTQRRLQLIQKSIARKGKSPYRLTYKKALEDHIKYLKH